MAKELPTLPPDDLLFERAACGLLVADTNGVILRANTTLFRWLGYDAAELIGCRRVQDLLTIGGRVFHQTHCTPLLQMQGSIAEVQADIVHRDGTRIPMLLNIDRQEYSGARFDLYALFVAADRRSYERELLKARRGAEASLEAKHEAETKLKEINQQLSIADSRKDEFLATLAHELRNPLAPMRNAIEVFKLKSSGEDNPLIGVLERQMHHMTHLVDDLMEVSRITQDRMELRRELIDLGTVMELAASDVQTMISAAAHTLTIELPSTPLIVDADATRLSQVLVNLLTNAAKYTPEGGRIWLRGERQGSEAVISVRDTGIGIAPESLPSVFEMFSQLEPAIERSKGGLGIGLALVRGLVKLHGGSISATSSGRGQGSEFTVLLPLADRAMPLQPIPLKTYAFKSRRVLVVDDNIDAAETLTMALDLSGYEARAAFNGATALALAATFMPEVVLLDIGLPDMNGYEVARRIRLASWGANIFLIAATGWGQAADKAQAMDAGFDRHMTKPINFAKLQALISEQNISAE